MANAAEFQPTRWSLISALRHGGDESEQRAREELCAAYWYPLYAYVRRSGNDAEEARDLTQGFFEHLLEKNVFALADRERGRLRTFLLTALKRFLRDEWRKDQQLKRGAGAATLSIDELSAEERYAREPADPMTAEVIYERRWALLMLERTVTGLREEYVAAGKSDVFDVLKAHLAPDGSEPSGEDAGARLGISAGAARVAVTRLRLRYRERLLREVAASMDAKSESEVDEEIDALFRALG
jgi:DNA-directed RNA polymerase specialized sigma24 family protein